MARINLHDNIFHDPRFLSLAVKVGNPYTALGLLSVFWFATQRRWGKGELLPKEEFLPEWQPLIECHFAEERDDGFYARGAEEHFAWYAQRCASSVRGGKNSATSRKEKTGSSQPNRTRTGVEPESNRNRTEPEPASNPPTPTPTPTQKDKINMSDSAPPALAFDFERIWSQYPNRGSGGKREGIEMLKKQIRTESEFSNLDVAVQKYAAYMARAPVDGEFIPAPKHFKTWCSKGRWKDCLDPEFGMPTAKNNQPLLDWENSS